MEETKVREIKDGEEDEETLLVVKAFAIAATNKDKKITLNNGRDPESICSELSQDKQKQYMDIVDFDEHFNDVSLDWTNPEFDGN